VTPHRVRGSVLVAAALAALANRAPAQSPEHPLLVLSMGAGYVTGGSIWRLDRQYALVFSPAMPREIDSVALGRLFRPGFEAGLGVTLFRSPHFGFSAEISFLGISTESRCSPLGPFAADSRHVNEQACVDIQGKLIRTNAAAFQAGATWRPAAAARVQPYLRAVGGLALLGGSFVETGAVIAVPGSGDTTQVSFVSPVFLADQDRRELTWIATLAVGATMEASPGTQLRFEVRDIITNVPSVTGPGDHTQPQPFAQMGSRTVHLLALTVALDLVLERQRTRRY
jgi:hypothetical protein